MNNKKYIIAVDLDGTLLFGYDQYDKESFEYLKSIKDKHHIIIATGRPYRSSKFYYDLIGLNTPIINYNGSLVQHPTDPSFHKFVGTVEKENIIKMIEDNIDILLNVFCEIEDDIYLWNDSYDIEPYLHVEGGNLKVGNFRDTLPANPNGAIIFTELGTQARLKTYIETHFQSDFRIRFWENSKFVISEVYHIHTSKATGLKKICEFYNVSQKNLIAIGDGHNDIEMIALAEIGVAMGNAHIDLKNIAKYNTLPVEEHGVQFFLKNFLENHEKEKNNK